MADHNERWVLNHLIEMCRDEERTLRFAAEHVSNQTVRTLFGELAARRAEFADQLVPHAQRLGGADASEGTTRGAIHRRWVALKDTLLGHNEMTIIQDAESLERDTLLSFENALKDLLPPTSRDLIEQQCDELRKSHERVRSLLMH